jgi:hypothetical protein
LSITSHSVSSFAGDWNLGGDLDGADGALGVVRALLEDHWGGDTRDAAPLAKLAEAILIAYRYTSKQVPDCCPRVFKEDLSDKADGVRQLFTTRTKLAGGQTSLYLNGIKWTQGFVVLGDNSFTLEPYGDGTAAYANDTIEVEGVVVTASTDGALWFDEDTNSGHLVTIGL